MKSLACLTLAKGEVVDEALVKAQKAIEVIFSPGKLLSEKKIKLEGKYPGREFAVEVPQGPGLYRSRIYMVKGRLYQVIVVGAKEFASAKEAEQVLASFKLLR